MISKIDFKDHLIFFKMILISVKSFDFDFDFRSLKITIKKKFKAFPLINQDPQNQFASQNLDSTNSKKGSTHIACFQTLSHQ